MIMNKFSPKATYLPQMLRMVRQWKYLVGIWNIWAKQNSWLISEYKEMSEFRKVNVGKTKFWSYASFQFDKKRLIKICNLSSRWNMEFYELEIWSWNEKFEFWFYLFSSTSKSTPSFSKRLFSSDKEGLDINIIIMVSFSKFETPGKHEEGEGIVMSKYVWYLERILLKKCDVKNLESMR